MKFTEIIVVLFCLALSGCGAEPSKPRVVVSTDIGGTDDDDFQSMIHYLMYADRFDTEGLISSAYGNGRVADIHKILDLYEQDYPALISKNSGFPTPEVLRQVTKQGETERAPLKGFRHATEGSSHIVQCARKQDDRPLWILVWGGLEDLAQALHDAPDIVPNIRVYWIGGPNKKWGADAYHYIVSHFPDLWMIEANATYRGLFADDNSEKETNVKHYYNRVIQGRGAMGKDFLNYYGGVVKMGDTPSVAYLMEGDPEAPDGKSWGGSFRRVTHSPLRSFERQTTLADTVPVFGVVEWVLDGPETIVGEDEPVLKIEIAGQQFEGYYAGSGKYKVRFATKAPGEWRYKTMSDIAELDGLEGAFVSTDPWPGDRKPGDAGPLTNWWSDDPDAQNYESGHQGARTVARFREAFLLDWAQRWKWLEPTRP